MERRGRIPVAKFRTQEAKSRSRSRVREPDYNEQDPETDLFTLLEDNIALKEENKTLKAEIDTMKKSQDDWQADKSRIELQLKELKAQQSTQEAQIREFTNKCIKLNNERNALDKLHKMKVDIIESLKKDVEMLQDKNKIIKPADATLMLTSDDILSKLIKVLPTLHIGNELESLVEVDNPTSIPLTVELMERLIDEFLVTKSTLSSVELQLYEANEKLSELLEHQQHLQEDNEALRTENEKLTKVAKLLTDNMRESVETSQKMEAALLSLKKRNDELVAKLQDQTDGNSKTVEKDVKSDDVEKLLADENQVEAIQQAVEIQNRDHGERIVEMKNLIDAAIEKTTNAELKTLQVKLEILEADLRQAIERAENAEKELEKYKSKTIVSPTPPPPPPPPLPPKPFSIATKSNIKSLCDLHNLHISENIRSNGGNEKGNRIIGTVKQQVNQEITTGVDALVQELKSGRVTLRRRQRRSVNTNDALQEMFQVLEISQKQNRNSKICMDLEM